MTAVPQKVLNWLYSVLTSEYSDVNRTYTDVAQTLSHYSSLSPRTDVYTYESGHSSLLLHLNGTLPVTFRGITYRFPIALWLPHSYPKEAPICYVTPTPGMAIRPGQYVSGEGRVYHPYLADWADGRGGWNPNLLDFLSILREVFTRQPPVIARQQQPQAPPTDLPPADWRRPAPPPLPPLPPELSSPASPLQTFPRHSTAASIPPPPPPKPFEARRDRPVSQTNGPPPVPPIPGRLSSQHSPPLGQYKNGQVQPPLPGQQYAPQQSSGMRDGYGSPVQAQYERQQIQEQYPQASFNSPVRPVSPDKTTTRYLPHSSQNTNHGPPPPALPGGPGQLYQRPPPPQQQTPIYPTAPHQQAPPQPKIQYLPYPPQQQKLQQPSPQTSRPPQEVPDLLTSSLDNALPPAPTTPGIAPPIPPNPEKDALLTALSTTLTHQLHSTIHQNTSTLPSLHAQSTALQSSSQSLQHELHTLHTLSSTLTSNEKILHSSLRAADHVMASAAQRQPPNVDDVLVVPTIVGGQLYELVAEEQAIGDAIFVLGRGLDGGRVGVEGWLRLTRGLARERFLKKALVRKIVGGMGLDEGRRGWR